MHGRHEYFVSKDYVKNLGSYFGKSLSMNIFVCAKCKAACYNTICISQIRRVFTKEATEALMNEYVTSRLDYSYLLLFGKHKTLISKLQRAQNIAAHVFKGTSKYDHIIPVLKEVHWLFLESV